MMALLIIAWMIGTILDLLWKGNDPERDQRGVTDSDVDGGGCER